MLMLNAKTDIRSIWPLHALCRALAILPPVSLGNVEVYKCKYWYGILTTCLLLATYAYTLYGKVVYMRPVLTPAGFLLDVASDLTLIVASVVAIVCVNLRSGRQVCDFLVNIKKIDRDFRHVAPSCKRPNARFATEMILVHAYLIAFIGFNVFTWLTTVGAEVYKFFFLRDVQNYFVMILAMLLRHYAYAIKYRSEVLNGLLATCQWTETGEIFVADFAGFASRSKSDDRWTLRKLIKLFTRLANVVDQYNAIFGWQFVTLYVNIVINLLLPINLALVYGSGEKDLNGIKFGWELVTLCVFWGSLPILIGIAIYSACNHAADEIQRTSVIAYNLSQELCSEPKDLIYKRDLQELAQLASNRCPSFTAAGFFSINYSVLFGLVGSITSYLIVLIQFK